MLVLHSSSRCDVCLSDYSWEDTGKRPHAIACGHIFCRDCLYANSPPLCPLCRKIYQPAKIKKLHVDRPEAMDDNKELDFLQRLALAWEFPPEQLKDVIEEVDAWLRNRSDDSCIPLRKARAALERNVKLRQDDELLRDHIVQLQEQHQATKIELQREQHRGVVQAEANSTMIQSLQKKFNKLTLEMEGMASYSYRHTSRNPLPRPPEPISTDKIPTFNQAMEQAILESGAGSRSIDLPTYQHRQPFEVENRSHRKGKSKTKDPWLEGANRYHTLSPLQSVPEASIPPVPSSSLYHTSSQSPHQDPLYSSRATTLPEYADNTIQDFDIFNAMSFYMREYTSGFLNGQEVARNQRMSEGDNWYHSAPKASSSHGPSSSSRRHPHQPRPASAHQPNDAYRHSAAANAHQNLPPPPSHLAPVPLDGERSSRSSRRHETAPSIISSPAASSRGDRPSSTSQTRSAGGVASVPTHQTQTPIISPGASAYSAQHAVPLAPSVRSPSPRRSAASLSPLLSQPQQIVVQQPVVAPTPLRPPSLISHQTQPSIDTWGTAQPSNLASGSLIDGLLAWDEGAEAVMTGGQPSVQFRELNSHGTTGSRHSMVIDGVEALALAPNPEHSPGRPVHSMVGVLPDEQDPLPLYSPARERERSSSYRPLSNGEIYSPNNDQHQVLSPGRHRSRHDSGSGYQNDVGRGAERHHDQMSSGSVRGERSYRSSSSSARRHSSRQADQHSLTSSQSSLRVPPASRLQHLSLPEESPLSGSVQYTDDDERSTGRLRRNDSIEYSTESYNNALGLDF